MKLIEGKWWEVTLGVMGILCAGAGIGSCFFGAIAVYAFGLVWTGSLGGVCALGGAGVTLGSLLIRKAIKNGI